MTTKVKKIEALLRTLTYKFRVLSEYATGKFLVG